MCHISMKVADYQHDMDCAAVLSAQGRVFSSEVVVVITAQGSSLVGLTIVVATHTEL